jgi:hypothetical protein
MFKSCVGYLPALCNCFSQDASPADSQLGLFNERHREEIGEQVEEARLVSPSLVLLALLTLVTISLLILASV